MIRTALLIDADNVSLDVVRQVIAKLEAEPRLLQQRRAYGSVQKAQEFAELARDHAIRFLPSTFAGPNATDLALAIDAVELVLHQPLDEVVLVSSDRDFAPLIVRLRELGCRVTGYGQAGKSAGDIERDYLRVYDAYAVLDPSKPAKKAAAPRKAVTKASRRQAPAPAPVAAPAPELPTGVTAVLEACPELRRGEPLRLDGLAKTLREAGLLTARGKTTALFKKMGTYFELLPADKPERVRFIAGHD